MRFYLGLTTAILLANLSTAVWGPTCLATESHGAVELIRDNWGTPHVFAETDAGAMYGLGYACAHDRGFQMHYGVRLMQGRVAELVGDVAKVNGKGTALGHDRRMRTFGFDRAADRIADALDAESRAMLQAYSDGVNAYFAEHEGDLHELFARVGLEPEPWTPADCLLSWWHLAQFFATDGTRDLLGYRNRVEGGKQQRDRMVAEMRDRGRGPITEDLTPLGPDDATSCVQREDVSDQWIADVQSFLAGHGFSEDADNTIVDAPSGPKFSHAWVAGGRLTGTGSAVLVSKPQTPVANPSLLYEYHIQGDSFNARGVGVAGSPVLLIGWTENVAWGVTALGADQADLFRLKTDDAHPDQYFFDGQWKPMELVTETIQVKGGSTEELVVRSTHHGPIVTPYAFAREGDPEVALKRIPICETDRNTMRGFMRMIRAEDAESFYAAAEDWRFPSANVVFGDKHGTVGYGLLAALPLRSPEAIDSGRAAHDGTRSEADWCAMVPHELKPHVINPARDYAFSGNHRPVGSFYPISLGIITGAGGDTVRSWRLRQLFEGKDRITAEQVLAFHADAINPARYEIARIGYHVRDVLGRQMSADTMRVLDYCEAWFAAGAPSDLTVSGAELGTEINTFFRLTASPLTVRYGGGDAGLSRMLRTIGDRLDDDPKAEVSPLEQEYIDSAISVAWGAAVRNLGPDPTVWNEIARELVLQRQLGYFRSLDGFPSLDPERDLSYPSLKCVDGATMLSQAAEAYSQWVPLAKVDTARSILPPGNSERPNARQRSSNMKTWAAAKMNPAPITRKAVEQIAASRVEL